MYATPTHQGGRAFKFFIMINISHNELRLKFDGES